MKTNFLFLCVLSITLLFSCSSLDTAQVAVQAVKQTRKHQQKIDKQQGRGTEIEEEALFNGSIAMVGRVLRQEKC